MGAVTGGFGLYPKGSSPDGGVTTIGTFDGGTPSANGASIAGVTLFLQSASDTVPGLVNTTTQTFAGQKTFLNPIILDNRTVGSILFMDASKRIAEDNANFFWDDTNNRQGIGNAAPTSRLDVTTNSLGTTQATTSGLSLTNTTAAAAGAQQITPGLRLSSNGWASTSGTSRDVSWIIDGLPVQGTTNPTGTLRIQSSRPRAGTRGIPSA